MKISPPPTQDVPVVVIGAGPAGLTAAYELTQRSLPVLVFEGDHQVGGIARTVDHHGFRFDIGGHRFFTKIEIVRRMWKSMLGEDLLTRPRVSRIYYQGRFFDYPLRPLNAFRNLGPVMSARVVFSYLWSKLFPIAPEDNFEAWTTNRFGRRLYEMFFRTYTEKVWGIPCHEIGAEWAAQRIRGLSLRTAVLNMFFPERNKRDGSKVKTLIDEFEYPRLGPGMMWEAFRDRVEESGGRVRLSAPVGRLHHDGTRVRAVEVDENGQSVSQPAAHVISTMPLRELIQALRPSPPPHVVEAAGRLKYRDFLTVAVTIDRGKLFDDNWIYVHDSSVRVGRIQNFKNWSPDMVPDPAKTCLGLEYFCFEGDGLWTMEDDALIELAGRELALLGLADTGAVSGGVVVRMPKAYPVYNDGFSQALEVVKSYLERFENLQTVGRNGMHRYNNQDHSMLTAILAVRNLFDERHDLWGVNAEEDYHEELRIPNDAADAATPQVLRDLASTQPMVPRRLHPERSD
jgi:protoporphyrinogen oxidase